MMAIYYVIVLNMAKFRKEKVKGPNSAVRVNISLKGKFSHKMVWKNKILNCRKNIN
jgi:hypothetical protein